MKRANSKAILSMFGIVVIAVGATIVAAQAASSAPAQTGGDNGTYFAPGAHVDIPIDQGPSQEEMDVFNKRSEESFRQLVKENPDLELHDLNR